MFAGSVWLGDRGGLGSVYLTWIINNRTVIVTEPVYSTERLIFLLYYVPYSSPYKWIHSSEYHVKF